MADAIATLGLNVDANGAITSTNKLSESLGKLGGEATKAETSLKSMAARFGAFVTAAAVLHKFVGETISAQNAMAQLEAAVKSTSGAAGRSVGQLSEMSAQIQKVSTFSDDAVQSAQAMLLTFNSIKGGTFDEATRAVVDLATRMGGDLSGAAVQVGKALQDPVTGITALRRSGVSFSDAQQEVIKKLVETNQLAKAQALILAELNLEFGGAAAAARDTLGGALTGLQNAFGDLFEVSRSNSGGLIAALNVLADNLDAVFKAATAVAVVFAGKFLADAAKSATGLVMGMVKVRAETLAYAEDQVRTAAATKTAAVAHLAQLEAEKVELRTLMALERERLTVANARVARAVPEAVLAPLGAAVAGRDNAEVAFATKAAAESQEALNVLRERQVVVNGAVVASNGAVTASTNALTTAQLANARATNIATAASKGLQAVWSMLGGTVGIVIIGIIGAVMAAMNHAATAKEKAKKAADDYRDALTSLSPAALNAALATEKLGLALQEAHQTSSGAEYNAKIKSVAATKERIEALEKFIATQKKVATAATNEAVNEFTNAAKSATEQLKVFNTSGKVAADAFKMANERWVDSSGRMRRFADALNEGDAAAVALNAAALSAATATDALGKAATTTKAAVKVLNKAFEEQDELFRRIAKSTASLTDELLDAMNARLTATNAANIAIAESIDKRKEDNKQMREQIAALLISEKAYRAVLLVQAQAAAVKAEQDKLPTGQTLDEGRVKQIRAMVAESANLKDALDAALGLLTGGTATKETENWTDALREVIGIAQLIGAAFGDVGQKVNQIGAGAQSIVAGLKAATSIKDSAGNGVSFGKAMSGGAGISGVVSGLGAAGAVVGGVMAVADAFDLFGKKAKENARVMREAANSVTESLAAFRRQTALTAGSIAASISSMKDTFGNQIANLLKASFGQKAELKPGTTGFDYVNAETVARERAKAAEFAKKGDLYQPMARAHTYFADEVQKMLDAITERVKKETPKLLSTLDAYYNAAFGNEGKTQLDQAAEQWNAWIQDLSTSLNAGGLTVEQYNTQMQRLNEAYTETTKKIKEEIAAKERQKKEAERRSVFDMDNGALAFTNPRGARDAEMVERANRRMTDAVERNASATELLSIASFNAAEALNYLREQAEADLRTSEGLVGRILGTMGNDRATQDYTTAANQRQEMADAIKEGMSDTNIALLEFTHFAENSYTRMTRAIEDGTKAINEARAAEIKVSEDIIAAIEADSAAQIARIDGQISLLKTAGEVESRRYTEQISAIREQTKAATKALDLQIEAAQAALTNAQSQVSALEKVVSTNEKVMEALKAYGDSLKLGSMSTLSPEGKLVEARRQFESLAAAASNGDATAAGNLPGAASALLEASRGFNASNEGFVTDYNRVQSVVDAVKAQFGATLPIDQLTLIAAQQQVEQLQSAIEAMGQQKDAITDAAEAQIEVLEEQKAAAAENTQKQITKLEAIRDAIKKNADDAIDRENQRIEDINTRADAEIERLKKVEEAAHLQRLKGNENWETFLRFIGSGGVGGGVVDQFGGDQVGPNATEPKVDPQLEELKSMNATLDARLANVEDLLVRSLNVEAASTREETGATYAVLSAVNVLINETRAAAQAAAARTTTVQKR